MSEINFQPPTVTVQINRGFIAICEGQRSQRLKFNYDLIEVWEDTIWSNIQLAQNNYPDEQFREVIVLPS